MSFSGEQGLDHSHRHHDDHHGHSSAHHHGHHHTPPANFGNAFMLAIALNIVFVVVEFSYGLIAHSTALIADAGHNLSDVLGLALAWGATILARRQPSERYTYGLRSSSILAALGNAMLLLFACGAIAWEAMQRFAMPANVSGLTVSVVAAIGILVNGASALLFISGSKHDLNIRGAYLHMVADAVVSLGVVVTGVLIMFTGWDWMDPLISLVIVAVIVVGTWGLLRDALRLSLNAVPPGINLPSVQQFLAALPGVTRVCDLHIWGMSTTENALTAHLSMPDGHPGDGFLKTVAHDLEHRFSIHHSTLQITQESGDMVCKLVDADSARENGSNKR